MSDLITTLGIHISTTPEHKNNFMPRLYTELYMGILVYTNRRGSPQAGRSIYTREA